MSQHSRRQDEWSKDKSIGNIQIKSQTGRKMQIKPVQSNKGNVGHTQMGMGRIL